MKPSLYARWAAGVGLLLLGASLVRAQTYTISPPPFLLAQNNSGVIINNACIWTYLAGTSTAATTYSDNAGTTNSNPIRSDSAGRFTAFLVAGNSYKFVYESACVPPAHGTTLRTADNIAAMPGSSASVDVTGTVGESVTAGLVVYLSDGSGGKTAGQWFKADSANTYSSTLPPIGLALSAITVGNSGTIRISGGVTGLGSLVVGSNYYIGTAGAMTTTAPANLRLLGRADTATSFVVQGPTLAIIAPVSLGGTGLTATPTNGQLPIGNATGYTLATLTAGSGVSITNGAGTITPAAISYVIDRDVSTNSISNSAVETTVYTFSVPGGTLSTNKMLRVTFTGQVVNTTGVAQNLTIRFKYGATTAQVATISILDPSTSSVSGEFYLAAHNATGTQRAWGSVRTTSTAGANTMQAILTHYVGEGPVAEDSTASKTLAMTWQLGTASANFSSSKFIVQIELV
jgi:hypothetical protein